jgi:hypothetical protein
MAEAPMVTRCAVRRAPKVTMDLLSTQERTVISVEANIMTPLDQDVRERADILQKGESKKDGKQEMGCQWGADVCTCMHIHLRCHAT